MQLGRSVLLQEEELRSTMRAVAPLGMRREGTHVMQAEAPLRLAVGRSNSLPGNLLLDVTPRWEHMQDEYRVLCRQRALDY